jgi:aminomethyltransferase
MRAPRAAETLTLAVVAIGTVNAAHGQTGDELLVEIYYQREMHWSRVMAKAVVVDKPFWDPDRRRATPPALA